MTLGLGYDSAFPPTPAQAQAAKSMAGPIRTWWGFYLPGVPNTDPTNTWTPQQMAVLVNAGWIPVPIVVPAPPHPASPIDTATTAFRSATIFGLKPQISVCYNGEHIPANGPVWLPIPGAKPTAVGPQSAIQWGATNIQGIDVDVSASAEDFPASTALVCDLEHNAQYDSAWYATFQATVAFLGKNNAPPPVPPVSRKDKEMFLVVIKDSIGPLPKDTSYLVTDNGLMPVVDDLTSVFGKPIAVSNGQAKAWSTKTPKL